MSKVDEMIAELQTTVVGVTDQNDRQKQAVF